MTGKMFFFATALLIISSITTAAETRYAWWLTVEFEPHGTEVWGVPVKKLNEGWRTARLLEPDDVPEDTGADRVREQMQQYDLSFQLSDDFDNDGEIERAGVGVFEREDGSRGAFLVVVGPQGEVEFLEVTNSTKAGFGVLRREAEGVSHWYCLECGHGFDLKATGPDAFAVIEPEPYG